MGGEKLNPALARAITSGSPPHGRGKDPHAAVCPQLLRITPAWAGKRHKAVLSSGRYGDHPRRAGKSCPVHRRCSRHRDHPRAGGEKFITNDSTEHPTGITPAWAGKSFAVSGSARCARDHPRVGGEKFSHALPLLGGVGSPPRGRGKARHLSHGLLPCG